MAQKILIYRFLSHRKNKLANTISQAFEAIHPLFRLQCDWLCWDLLCVHIDFDLLCAHIDFPSEKGKLPYKHIFSWKPLLVERTLVQD